jgi:peptidoglycan/xylan/chitin deacetylase (PgdA/CDA1 family)
VKLAIKVDVDTYRGTRDGVPRLVRLLQLHEAGATFLFSLGPDHTGRAIRRAFRPGFFSKVHRTSVLEHYGLRTLLYGTALPGPDVGRRCRDEMRAVKAAGFEVGVHCWDHVRWQDNVAHKDADWTEREMQKAFTRFREVFGTDAVAHGAAGWQLNRHAAWFEERHFAYASDTRGREPFRPLWDGVAIGCPQLPTTLPTLDEMIGTDGINKGNASARILGMTEKEKNHVFTAHAELEGGDWHGIFDALLRGWRRQGYELVSLKTLYESLDLASLPRHEIVQGEIPGRSGTLALQA